MLLSRKLLYMVLGGFMALALTFGAYATFAQTDDGGDDGANTPALPGGGNRGERPDFDGERPDLTDKNELLADALGVTVEELEAAREAVRVAAIEQAVADGVLTQEQADEILSNENGPRGGKRGLPRLENSDELLAEELGVTVEALEAAREEVQAARLAEMVEAGVLTQEQADMMEAQRAVRSNLDTDAINEAIQEAYEAAIEQALADGDITQEQADQMLENLPTFNPGQGGSRGGGHRGGPRGGGPRGGGQGGFGPDSSSDYQTAPVDGQDA